MSFQYFLRLVLRNIRWLILIPSCLALAIFYFTRNEIKTFSSETLIYTGIASGSNLNDSKIDAIKISNSFDNLLSLINSRETKEAVALQLLSEHLILKKYDPSVLSQQSYANLKTLVPLWLKKKLVKPSAEATMEEITRFMKRNDTNLVYRIVNAGNTIYSIQALQNVKASRIFSSDLIKITFEGPDAAVCKHTLELMITSFMKKQWLIKAGQSGNVVAYFEKQTRDAYARLDSMERIFLDFNKRNDIINYLDQTKAVAGQRENLYALDHSLRMDEKAAENSLETVNEGIKGRIYQSQYGSDLISVKNNLSDIYNKIAVSEVMSKETEGGSRQLDSLKRVATTLENRLQESMTKLYEKSNTPNGIPTRQVLDQWLSSSLAYEQSKARLSVMDRRKKEFVEEYKRYAPIGAMLKKIERQINVQEREYLDYLHSLSVAKMSQQNDQLTSKLTIVDPPFLPITPNKSVRKILVLVGFIAGFLFVLTTILIKAFLNKTLQEPKKAGAILGVPLLGIYPILSERPELLAKANLRLMQQLQAKITANQKPVLLGVISIEQGEGKSTMIQKLMEEIKSHQYTAIQTTWNVGYTPASENTDIVFVEVPALENTIIRPELLPRLNHAILVCKANRTWGNIDKNLLANFIKTTKLSTSFILNGVESGFLNEYIGTIPNNSAGISEFLKRLFIKKT